MRSIFLCTFLYLSITAAYSSNYNIPESVKDEIHRLYPGNEVKVGEKFSIGDIDDDGTKDIAVIIEYERNNRYFERLVVLTGTSKKKYVFSSQTDLWEMISGSPVELSINNSSIYLTRKFTSQEIEAQITYQFKKIEQHIIMYGFTKERDGKYEDGYNLMTNKSLTVFSRNWKGEEVINTLKDAQRIKLDEFSFDNEYRVD